MRSTARTVGVLLLLLAASAAPADEPPAAGGAKAWLADLASDDPARRASAARWLVVDPSGPEAVARGGADLGEDAWKAFAETFVASSRDAAGLVGAVHTAPPAHRERLVALIRRRDPEACVAREPADLAALVEKRIRGRPGDWCATGRDREIALLGRDAAPELLRILERDPGGFDGHMAAGAIAWIAEPEDVPRLRAVLLAGHAVVCEALAALQRRGVASATDALFDAIHAGVFDPWVAAALSGAPDRERLATAVLHWANRHDEGGAPRLRAASLLGEARAYRAVPLVERWLDVALDDRDVLTYGTVLARLGSRRGVEVLVRIVREPPVPGGGAAAGERLCKEGFDARARWLAVRALAPIAGAHVNVPAVEDDAGLARLAAEFRVWWEARGGSLLFDPAAGRWSSRD